MSKKLEHLRDTLCGELEKVAKKDEISMSDLDIIDKLTHSLKNLDKVMLGNEMIEQYGYDFQNYSGARRGRDGDGDGRYNEGRRSRDSYDYSGRSYGDGRSYDRSYDNSRDYSGNRGGYSGHDKEIDRFKMMMQDAVNQL